MQTVPQSAPIYDKAFALADDPAPAIALARHPPFTKCPDGAVQRSFFIVYLSSLSRFTYSERTVTEWKQCEAVVMTNGRTLIPPRRCRKIAKDTDEYCEVHAPQRELQELYRRCLRMGWEGIVRRELQLRR